MDISYCAFHIKDDMIAIYTNKIIKSKTKLMKMTIANRCGGSTWQLLLLLNKVEINNKSINPLINARL